ncbi:MAG: hypothetical protein NZT61_06255 [Deltaproteobacteria bacterium]|nr:hypothetical protein [Deltaproteobacteria bacterium]
MVEKGSLNAEDLALEITCAVHFEANKTDLFERLTTSNQQKIIKHQLANKTIRAFFEYLRQLVEQIAKSGKNSGAILTLLRSWLTQTLEHPRL